ncbi:hypothetical protein N0V85_009938, partial [Neurospora sp. IMI 360204]
ASEEVMKLLHYFDVKLKDLNNEVHAANTAKDIAATIAKILREELDYTKQKLKEAQINTQWNAEFNKPAEAASDKKSTEATNNKFPKGTSPFAGIDEDVWSDIYSTGDDKPDGAGGANGRGYGGRFSIGGFGVDGIGRADGGSMGGAAAGGTGAGGFG